jgi:Bifunctional DNA primase/polymerase, N-terminal
MDRATSRDTDLLRFYDSEGIKLVRLSHRTKKPVDDEWQRRTLPLEDLEQWVRQGGDVGWQCGEVSGWVSAVDLDCPEARKLAPKFLPETLRGAKGQEAPSQYFYRAPGLGYKKFSELGGPGELIALKASNNGRGHQVAVAPSVHREKGQYQFVGGYNPAAIAVVDKDDLRRRVGMLAAAALIARHLPPAKEEGGGGRHDLALALAGFMLRNGEAAEDVEKMLVGAWAVRKAPRDALEDVRRSVRDTETRLTHNDSATGGRRLEELVPGLAPKIADFLGWERANMRELPRIVVNNRHLRDVTAEAIEALAAHNNPPDVFVRAGRLVRVRKDENGTPQIQVMEDSHVKGRLARVADFVRVTEKGETRVNPPDVVVKDIQALDGWPFPPLEAVVESPVMRPDGTIFDTPGYDPQTRLYYRPAEGFNLPPIPQTPTESDIEAAVRLLDEAVGEFPYEDEASAANTLALMLTALVRQVVNGPVPLALIDKPQAGTGGSLLAETISVIGSGRTAEMLGAPRDEEEWRKQITAKLSAGATMITVDNVEGALYAPSLARALTARTWTDRVLGRSETVTVSQRATWIATGNNIQLRGDLPRRCYWIRLDARDARPWQRQDFRHPDLLGWVTANRGQLVHALLTLARAWFAADKPKAPDLPRLGSFESWTETVGGMVAFARIPGFLTNLAALYDKADEGNAEWEEFLHAWWETFAEDPVTVAQIVKKVEADEDLREALPPDLVEAFDKSKGSFSRRLGNALSKRAGTRYGEDALRVVKAGELRRAVRWQLEKGSSECEFVSFVSLYNPSAGKNSEENGGTGGKNRSGESETNSPNSQTHTAGVEEGR